MRIVIDNSGVSIKDEQELKTFQVDIGASPITAQQLVAAWGAGRLLDGGRQAAIRIDFIEKEVGALAGDEGWRQGFARMVDYARTKSWLSPDGTEILGHIEWAGPHAATGATYRVGVVGLGAQGRGIVGMIAGLGHDIVGAVDIGDLVGRPIRDIVPAYQGDAVVFSSIEALLDGLDAPPDIMVLAASVDFDTTLDMAGRLLDRGVNVIGLDQDLFSFDPVWAPRLHARAVAGGATLMGAGVQDVWWVQLITLAAASVVDIKKITLVNAVPIEVLSLGIGHEIGVPLTREAFAEHAKASAHHPSVIGAPLVEAARRMGAKAGPVTKTVEPIFTGKPYEWKAGGVTLAPDMSQGIEERVSFETDMGFEVEGVIAVVPGGEESAANEIRIDGTPNIKVQFGPITREVTDITLIARIPDVIAASPGVLFSADLPAPRHAFARKPPA